MSNVQEIDTGTMQADIAVHQPERDERTKKVTSGSNQRQRRHLEQFRTDDDEHAALHEKARAAGLTFGAYMRAAKLGDAGPRAKHRAPVDVEALTAALVALNRVGNNQNQTTRALNELLLIAHEQSNARLESMVMELAEAIRDMPVMFAEPVAAVLAALGHDREG
jgi:hypothetical protein